MKKILLLGPGGQVGRQLSRSLAGAGELVPVGSDALDLRDAHALRETVRALRPAVVVNAAAFTAVDAAQDDPDTAFAVNARACEVLAQEAERLGAWLVHYSTDYVYDGSGERPWTEQDAPAPLNVYGASKLAGDQAIAAACSRHLIFRTGWVYGSWGGNFLKSILRAAAARDSLDVVCDQWGSPTAAALIADVTAAVLARPHEARVPGTYHLAAAGFTTWHGYAQLAVAHGAASGLKLRATPETIRPIPAHQYPMKAPRPANCRLDTRLLQATYGLRMPPWQDGVRATVEELAADPSRLAA